MFTSRVAQRVVNRVPKAHASTRVVARDGVFKEKTFKEAWFGDAGAYPCMATFVFGLGFCSSFGTYYLSSCPDVRLVTGYSRSRMFRGALEHEYLKEEVDICK